MFQALANPFHFGGEEYKLPLQRYLPPLSRGSISHWLEQFAFSPSSWLLDPFGAQPALAIEAAKAGARVLVAVNNPILAHLLETLCAAPRRDDFQSVLAELGATRRNEERLERSIRASYQSPCPACNATATVTAYLWHAKQERPFARLLRCSTCGLESEAPLSPEDIKNLSLPGSSALTRARALSRVSAADEGEIHQTIEKTLQVYPERALYLLFTLINKSEGLALSPERRRLLDALLLSACDAANTLWPWPTIRTRPRQLTIPPQYRENNLWLALEEAVEVWGAAALRPIPCTRWPEFPPPNGGICIYPGRVRSLAALPDLPPIYAVLTILPRPNQALWTLSALWSGWLWGREAVQPIKAALERRRYDWTWHTAALYQVWQTLQKRLPEGTPILADIPEITPGFIAATIGSAHAANLRLEGLALNSEQETLQTAWRISSQSSMPPSTHQTNFLPIIRSAIEECLERYQEPAAYIQIYTAAVIALAQQNALASAVEPPADQINRIQAALHQALQDPTLIRRSDKSNNSLEISSWESASAPNLTTLPLADRIEMELVRFLVKTPEATLPDIQLALTKIFPGLLTPPLNLIQAILDSYAEPIPGEPVRWRLQSQEAPNLRRSHIQTIQKLLCRLSTQLGYTCQGETPLLWLDNQGHIRYAFHITASSIISRFVYAPPATAQHKVIVLPGGRSNLLHFKLNRDAYLHRSAQGWQFLKFRHLRQLAERPGLTPAQWDELLDADPPRWQAPTQMTIF